MLQGYKPPSDEPSEYQTIPLNKIEDFGVHCKSYYSLDITYFKSALDRRLLESLWNKYWVNTLSSSSLLTVLRNTNKRLPSYYECGNKSKFLTSQNAEYTTGQIFDLSDKLEQSESSLGRAGMMLTSLDPNEKKSEDKLTKATKDSCKITAEVIHGLMSQVIKNRLFNHTVCLNPNNAPQAMEQH